MYITTSGSPVRTELKANKFFWLLAGLLACYWIYGWNFCIDRQDWIIENLLVVICLSVLVMIRKWHRFSDLSYLCIFLFVMLHLYGAFYAYTQNAFGSWLQNKFLLWRNPYDRIVHFSFGFFMAYPFRELLIHKFRVSSKASWLLPVEIAFSFGTIFELIEWGVSGVTTKETGETYVATQGDVWDAHKDILLAAAGAALCMLLTYIFKRKKQELTEPGSSGGN
jgi:putative membrane protein